MSRFIIKPYSWFRSLESSEFIDLHQSATTLFVPPNRYDLDLKSGPSFVADLEDRSKEFSYSHLLQMPTERVENDGVITYRARKDMLRTWNQFEEHHARRNATDTCGGELSQSRRTKLLSHFRTNAES